MRIANIDARAVLLDEAGRGLDIAAASDGEFGPSIHGLYGRWDEFAAWARARRRAVGPGAYRDIDLGRALPPSPTPAQVFAVGLNYADHAGESGVEPPAEPAVFTKFATCLTGADARVVLPAGTVDWEVELVVVIGRRARDVDEADAWDHVAGLTIGQDLSERTLQHTGPMPQFSLAKSYEGFGPMGPVLVTPDEFPDPDDLAIGCRLNGEAVQKSRTKHMIFPVPVLIAKLSAVTTLLPGDVIFSGTPSGVGAAQNPPRFLGPDDTLVSFVEGVGVMTQTFERA
ncbi:fumarylacetoacetate hydrolase family protein [Actinomadura syzygii]|uniref:Fumarylacetoacetate hydrolase family protein n=1 Tax=Actinomadura syzygii TaxID=1427538 RepID=A0A5D0UE73_9ACTN|nr:fumarylacetoacetate hydrolase family protein [Actinomadura syzygii]TYC15915.1 fumarylacetoacetate hydrolase family protein [Actinomadura syzygii]